ncbi:MAG: metallophosphoesterase family protein [bacterium]|nr:metallophosphoesterase family protein [bacterium]
MIRLLFCTLAFSSPVLAQTTLVPVGATWAYLDDGSDADVAWRHAGFDDSAWPRGDAQLGYGDFDEVTLLDYGGDPDDKYITYYFRREFEVHDPSVFERLVVSLLRDDGAAVYLNGQEVVRDNLPSGSIDYRTLASSSVSGSEENLFIDFAVDPTHLLAGTNTIAAEVHQVGPGSSDLSFDCRVEGRSNVDVTRGPYLQLGTSTSVRVRWRTEQATDGRVWFGPSAAALTTIVSDLTVTEDHEVELAGLAPGTRYYYAYGSSTGYQGGGDAGHYFETAPAPGSTEAVRLWILGDSGSANDDVREVRDAYDGFAGERHTDAWVMLGDNAYGDGTDNDYQDAVFDIFPGMLRRSVLWPARGNHDRYASVYYDIFTLPSSGEVGGVPSGTEAYYSFDFANIHFVCLDSESADRSVGSPMWTWLQSDLSAADRSWLIAFWHHPPHSKGSHDSDASSRQTQMRENFLPLLEDHGVDLVLTGHSHSYERSYLIDGHYDYSWTFDESMKVDGGDGRVAGDGAYNKAAGPHAGAIYICAGCSGVAHSAPLDHPAMVHSVSRRGSLVLDVEGGRMDLTFLDSDGGIEDELTLLNETYEGTYCSATVDSEGCVARVEAEGVPEISGSGAFVISAQDLAPGSLGLPVYGMSPDRAALFGGVRCVGLPFRRLATSVAQGEDPCGGRISYDFNVQLRSGTDPALVAGATVYTQFWYRDNSPQRAVLSPALQFVIRP